MDASNQANSMYTKIEPIYAQKATRVRVPNQEADRGFDHPTKRYDRNREVAPSCLEFTLFDMDALNQVNSMLTKIEPIYDLKATRVRVRNQEADRGFDHPTKRYDRNRKVASMLNQVNQEALSKVDLKEATQKRQMNYVRLDSLNGIRRQLGKFPSSVRYHKYLLPTTRQSNSAESLPFDCSLNLAI